MGIFDLIKETEENVGSITESIPNSIWSPLMGGTLILVVGVIGLIAGQPWLFPCLGPTAYLQVEAPGLKSSQFYNAIVGHYVGITSGLTGIAIFGLWNAPSVLSSQYLLPVWVEAATIAIFLTIITNILLRSFHPPAAGMALLVSLGAFTTPTQIVSLIMGVLILTTIGEVFRRIRLAGNK